MPTYTGTSAFSTYTLENSGVASVTYSHDQSLIYVARRDGHIDVFNRATHGLVTSWTVGTGLGGMSLSEDGTFLLVTEGPNASGSPVVHRVSTADGSMQNYTNSAIPDGYFYDVQIIDAHTAIFSGSQSATLDLDTGAFVPSSVYASDGVIVSDHHLTLIALPGNSSGPLEIYDDRTGTVTLGSDYQNGFTISGYNYGSQAISEAAGQVAQFIYYGSINLFDLSLHAIRTVSVGQRIDGLAYDSSGTYLYAYLIDSGVLAKYNAATFTLVDQISVGTSSWHNHLGSGDQIHVSGDGNYITLSDTSAPPWDANGGHLQLIDLTARNEFFAGTSGADTFYGLDGNDTYVVNNVGDVVVETAANGADIVQTDLSSYTLPANVEVLVYTGGSSFFTGNGNTLDNILNASSATGGAQLYGDAGDDNLFGGSGNDLLDGGTGRDLMVGGLGSDTYIVDSVTDIVVENPNEGGQDTIGTYLANYVLSETGNVENLTLLEGAISGSGNSLDNLLIGDALANTLYGYGGNDRLDGGGGDDTMYGGVGNDTYVVDGLGDLVVENAGEGTDTIETVLSYSLAGLANVENLTLTGTADVDATGNASANVLTGNAGANRLTGGGGEDTMIGRGGNDTYVVDSLGDVVVENASEGNDTIETSLDNYVLGANLENLTLTGSAVSGSGNGLNNVLTGNTADNIFDLSQGGDDQVSGGGGNDIFRFGASFDGNDSVDGGAGSGDQVILQGAYAALTLGSNVTNVETVTVAAGFDYHITALDSLLSGKQVITINGASLGVGDDLYVNGAAETTGKLHIYGGFGADTLTGGSGNDGFFFGSGRFNPLTDHVDGGAGTDLVVFQKSFSGTISGANFTSIESVSLAPASAGGNGVFALTLADDWAATGEAKTISAAALTGAATIDGSAESSASLTILGGGGNDILSGGGGTDTISGGGGNDTIAGHAGNDTLFGGGGADVFMFGHGTGQDVVGDFVSGSDKLDLSAFGFASFQDVLTAAHDVGGNAVIDLGSGDTVTLTGVTTDHLHSGDFML